MADGTPVVIRPIRPEDEPLTVDFHKSLSEETVHLRYLGFLKGEALITHERLVQICFCDYDREITLVAERIQLGRNQRQISDAEYPIERPSGQTINETSSWHHSFGSDLPHPIENGIVCSHDDFDVVSAG